jgi:hypothetical protein
MRNNDAIRREANLNTVTTQAKHTNHNRIGPMSTTNETKTYQHISKMYGRKCLLNFQRILSKSHPPLDFRIALQKAKVMTFKKSLIVNGKQLGGLRFNSP